MKTIATIFLTVLTSLTFAQKIFTADNFSKEYYGKIQVSDTSEVFSKGWMAAAVVQCLKNLPDRMHAYYLFHDAINESKQLFPAEH